jgi:site-specific recombinase XerD
LNGGIIRTVQVKVYRTSFCKADVAKNLHAVRTRKNSELYLFLGQFRGIKIRYYGHSFSDKTYLFERSGHLAIIPTAYLDECALYQRARARRQSAYYVKEYLEWCENNSVAWDRATEKNIMAFSKSIPEPLASHNRKIDRICDFYRFCENHGVKNPTTRFIIKNPMIARKKKKRNLLHRKKTTADSPEPPCTADIFRFIAAIRLERNRLIAEVIYESGMRISEVLGLRKEEVLSYAPNGGTVNCKVVGKGDKERYVIIGLGVWTKLVAHARAASRGVCFLGGRETSLE